MDSKDIAAGLRALGYSQMVGLKLEAFTPSEEGTGPLIVTATWTRAGKEHVEILANCFEGEETHVTTIEGIIEAVSPGGPPPVSLVQAVSDAIQAAREEDQPRIKITGSIRGASIGPLSEEIIPDDGS